MDRRRSLTDRPHYISSGLHGCHGFKFTGGARKVPARIISVQDYKGSGCHGFKFTGGARKLTAGIISVQD